MSKFLGKLLSQAGTFVISDFLSVKVRRACSGDRVIFSISGSAHSSFSINRDFLLQALSIDSIKPDFFFRFSMGYKVKTFVGVEAIKNVHFSELDLLGGRNSIFSSNFIDSDYNYDILSFLLFNFNLSVSLVRRLGKNWISLNLKNPSSYCGRKKGSKNAKSFDLSSRDEAIFRAKHNMNVALSKNLFYFYKIAAKEYASLLNLPFSDEKCLKDFQSCRKM